MITLYHSPLACSLASRMALAESGLDHEVRIVRIGEGATRTPEYLAINPAGKVPALVIDGGVVTESAAILPLIADLSAAELFPANGVERAIGQALLGFIATAVHGAWTPVLFPERFGDQASAEAVRTAALHRLGDALQLLERRLGDKDYLLGQFSVCDLYLAVFLLWRSGPVAQGRLPVTPGLDGLLARLAARPAIGPVIADDLMKQQAAG